MRARVSEAASADVNEIRAFYGSERRDSRIGFNRELRKVTALLRKYPEAGKPAGKTAREFVMDTYPYSVIYYIEDEAVVISAIYHHSRDPKFWHDRFGPER